MSCGSASIIRILPRSLLHHLLPHQRNHKLRHKIMLASLSNPLQTIIRSIVTFVTRLVTFHVTATSELSQKALVVAHVPTDTLLQPSEEGIAHLRLSNFAGFTSVL